MRSREAPGTAARIDWLGLVTAAGGAALVGGVFSGFSSIVLPAVVKLPTGQAIATMQLMNKMAVRPSFMIPFLGTTALSVGIAIRQLSRLRSRRSMLAIGGALLYLATFAVTAAYHVPRNDRLAAMSPDSDAAATYWAENVDGWQTMNDLRAATSFAAAAAVGRERR